MVADNEESRADYVDRIADEMLEEMVALLNSMIDAHGYSNAPAAGAIAAGRLSGLIVGGARRQETRDKLRVVIKSQSAYYEQLAVEKHEKEATNG